MNSILHLITPLAMALSFSTAVGVFLHDTNLDKAFISLWSDVDVIASDDGNRVRLSSTPHTHPEHATVASPLKEQGARPRTTPRNSDRKHLWQKRTAKNTEFDGHRLTIKPPRQLSVIR